MALKDLDEHVIAAMGDVARKPEVISTGMKADATAARHMGHALTEFGNYMQRSGLHAETAVLRDINDERAEVVESALTPVGGLHMASANTVITRDRVVGRKPNGSKNTLES